MNKETYSRDIADAVSSFLTEDGWRFSFREEQGVFHFGLYLMGRLKKISYVVKVRASAYIVYAISPLGADEEDEKGMAAMAEFVCRVNYGLRSGNFELDMRDGELRFKSFVDCEGVLPTREMIRNSLYCPAAAFERYSDGILDVILGNASAKEAAARCEDALTEEPDAPLEKKQEETADGEKIPERPFAEPES